MSNLRRIEQIFCSKNKVQLLILTSRFSTNHFASSNHLLALRTLALKPHRISGLLLKSKQYYIMFKFKSILQFHFFEINLDIYQLYLLIDGLAPP